MHFVNDYISLRLYGMGISWNYIWGDYAWISIDLSELLQQHF